MADALILTILCFTSLIYYLVFHYFISCKTIKKYGKIILKGLIFGLSLVSFSFLLHDKLLETINNNELSILPFVLFVSSFTILLIKTIFISRRKNIIFNFIGLMTPVILIIFYRFLASIFNDGTFLAIIVVFLASIINIKQIINYLSKYEKYLLADVKQNLLSIFYFLAISILLIPFSLGSSLFSYLYIPIRFILSHKLVLVAVVVILFIMLTILRLSYFKQKTMIKIADVLLLIAVLNYFILTSIKDYLGGSFSLISPLFLSLAYYFATRLINKNNISRINAYLLLFSSSVTLFLLKPTGIGNDMFMVTVLVLVGSICLLLSSSKYYKFNLSGILISGILITTYFILALPFNIISQPSSSPFDLLYLSQQREVFKFYGSKENYPIILITDLFFILKNLIADKHAKLIVTSYYTYKIYYTYIFVVYFLILSFHFVVSVILTKFINLIVMQQKLIIELFANRRNRHILSKDFTLDLSNTIPSLTINSLNKCYEKDTPLVLKDLSLTWQGSKIIGLLGNNGAGKSTLIKVLSQKIKITSGTVEICRKNLEMFPAFCKKVIGYLPDVPGVEQRFTGREYLHFIAKINSLKVENLTDEILDLAKKLDIIYALDRSISSYSFGMKQKIALMSVLLLKTKILILDEPFTGLDPVTTATLHKVLKDYVAQGNMVIFSSHIIEIVNGLCDEIYFLYDGKLIDNNVLKDYRKSDKILEEHCMKLINKVTSNSNQ